jgi:hypothetical protein
MNLFKLSKDLDNVTLNILIKNINGFKLHNCEYVSSIYTLSNIVYYELSAHYSAAINSKLSIKLSFEPNKDYYLFPLIPDDWF